MRQHGRRGLADDAVEIQDVEIEAARTPSLASPAPRLLFYVLKIVQKRFGRFAGSDPSYGIEKIRLVGFAVSGRPHKC